MSFLCNNVAAFAVAMVASVLVWLFGGTRGDLLTPVAPWLIVFLVEVIFCFPQRHRYESIYDARERVWKTLKRDPAVWVSLGLLALLLVPFLNNGLCPLCDDKAIGQGLDPEPPVPIIPFCVNRLDHLNVVFWFALALPAMVAVRDGLTRRGKRLVLELIVWNGVAVAALGFVQGAMDAPGPFWSSLPNGRQASDFFATFGYPNMGGDYFTTLFGIAVALWRDRVAQARREKEAEEAKGDQTNRQRMFWHLHYFLIPAALFFFAALNTLSRAAIILVTSTAVVYFIHTLVSFVHGMRRARRVMIGVWSVLAFSVVVFFAMMFMPEKLQREVDTIGPTAVLDRVTGRGYYHNRVATEVWRDNKLFGCGGWGYIHLCIPKMTKEELKQIQMVGGINVHNDYLQFLAEHGLVGFGAMVAIVVILLWPVCGQWRWLVRDLRFKKGKDLPPKPIQIFALPAPVFIILVTAIATLIHAFGDCPLRSPAVLTLFFVSLAALPGFMPKLDETRRHHHHSHH